MATIIGADSLAFISLDGLYRALGQATRDPAGRISAMPASPATTRSRWTDMKDSADRQLSSADRKLIGRS